MNHIYQGKVTGVEIHVSANKENPWQTFDPYPKQAKVNWQSALWQHHQLFQDAMHRLLRIGWMPLAYRDGRKCAQRRVRALRQAG